MKISTAVKEYLIEIEVRKFTPKTIRSYRNNLNLFLRFCEEEADVTEIEDVSLAVVRQFSRFMSERGKKGSYINGLLKVAKAFIQYCHEEGYGGFNTRKNFKWCKQGQGCDSGVFGCRCAPDASFLQRLRFHADTRCGYSDHAV